MTGPPLTMNRVIHAAVRRDLERLSTALGRMQDGDRDRARALERAFANLRTELTHHHEGEDTHIWPMLARVGVDGALLEAMEGEHHAMADALAVTSLDMATVARSGSAADAAAARASIERTRLVVERHLQHEENELEPRLTPHLGTPEWEAVEKKLSRQPPRVAGRFFAWLTDGISDEHRAFLRTAVPAPVVVVLARTFGRRYYRDVAPVWRA
ncbi:hemerythrin domain-containing protein [Blastococcus tunisiensis]|uniref:Hemerythrin HHE cation binding domain-containing protein n=1 Tax=Blastococcus tunisiensis TaxID=1798228 RepID=A0A1I2KY44_9ACTN|nr:hemerythrin domain-containing protein [Blastococcus sp. DSM 46838]SFF72002.1 Hemerythrin HHE cation binding domain-containing protein [Blastococcus sp. DSM 46838]